MAFTGTLGKVSLFLALALSAGMAGAARAETSGSVIEPQGFRYLCTATLMGWKKLVFLVGDRHVHHIDSNGATGFFEVKQASVDAVDPNFIDFRFNAARPGGQAVYVGGGKVWESTVNHVLKVNVANPAASEFIFFVGDISQNAGSLECTTVNPTELLVSGSRLPQAPGPAVETAQDAKSAGARPLGESGAPAAAAPRVVPAL